MKIIMLIIIMNSPYGTVWTGTIPFDSMEVCQHAAERFVPLDGYKVSYKKCL